MTEIKELLNFMPNDTKRYGNRKFESYTAKIQ